MALSPAERAAQPRFAGLWVRVVSALVLAAIGGSAIWCGFPWIDLLAALATVLMIGEWRRICGGWRNPLWLAVGVCYIALCVVAFLWLRHEARYGLQTALWLVLVVAATDVGAYFSGKTFGGAKLAPRISPGKTWAGLFGGVGLAVVVAAVFCTVVGASMIAVCGWALLVALVSQAGDLLESAVKRRFGFKDAGRVIPGHGGLLDRMDGLAAAALFLAIVRLVEDGFAPWS